MLRLNAMNAVAINAATGTAAQHFAAIVLEKLCRTVCQTQDLQPMQMVKYSLEDQHTEGTTTFVDLVVNGKIEFVPKGGKPCQVIQKRIYERTTLIFANASATNPAPKITLTQGLSAGSLANVKCGISNEYQIATDVLVTAVYA